jgi:hypothetical protein
MLLGKKFKLRRQFLYKLPRKNYSSPGFHLPNDDQILISRLSFSVFQIFTTAGSLTRTKFNKPEKENTRTDSDNGSSIHQYYSGHYSLKTPKTSHAIKATQAVGTVEQNTTLPLHCDS